MYILDDVELMRNMMEALLRRQGFEIKCFSMPEHLLMDLVRSELHELPDIIVCDYGLQNGWTGVDVFHEIRKLGDPYDKIKMLGVSSTHPDAMSDFAILGVPFLARTTMDADALINTVRQLLGMPPYVYKGEVQ